MSTKNICKITSNLRARRRLGEVDEGPSSGMSGLLGIGIGIGKGGSGGLESAEGLFIEVGGPAEEVKVSVFFVFFQFESQKLPNNCMFILYYASQKN